MRIGIDARTILNPRKSDEIGAGHYAYQLIRHLLEIDTENEYVLFFDFRVREKDIKKFTRPNTKVVFYPFSDYKKYLPGAYSELLGAATLKKEKLDVLHVTSAKSRIPVSYRGKTVVTFNDLTPFVVPDALPRLQRGRDKTMFSYMAKKATHVIAASNSVGKDLVKHCGAPKENISVVHSGLDQRFFAEPAEQNTKKVVQKFGVKKKYVLFLGTLEPSKNIARLLHAFSLFRAQRIKKTGKERCDYQLVLAGKRGWLSKEYHTIAKDLGIAKDLVYTGYVIGDELTPLFHHAEFFVLPSLYEGFGTTVLEAFATGTPAIVSDVGSLPEIAGSAARFVNPIDTKEIAQAMIELADKPELREEFAKKGLAQAKKFDWKKTAEQTLAIYKKIAA